MNTADLITFLKRQAIHFAERAPDAKWYLFGSALVDNVSAEDIDLLIIYSTDEDAITIRHYMEDLCLALPLHLLLMNRAEEAECDFVATQNCVQLYPDLGVSA